MTTKPLHPNPHRHDPVDAVLLKLADVQANLARQDRTLEKLDSSVNGNGRPGLVMRVDRLRAPGLTLGRVIWLLFGTAVATVAHELVRWK